MKKILSILIIAVLFVTCLVPAASAAGTVSVTAENKTAQAGDQVTIAINITEATFATFGIMIGYDANELELVSIVPGGIGALMLMDINPSYAPNTAIVGGINSKDITYGGTVAVATFKVKDTAKVNDVYNITVTVDNFTTGAVKDDATTPEDESKPAESLTVSSANGSITIPCVNHSFTKYEYNNDAKCGVDGTMTATCDICGKVTDTQPAPNTALEHKFTNYVSNGDAKCEVDGTKTAVCDNGCGEKSTIADEGSALTHSFTNYVYNNDAKCEVDGTETATCDNGCGKTDTRTAKGTALEHQWTTDDKAPTCTEDGVKDGKHCELCGEIVSGTVLPATGHDYESVVTKEPTCEEEGVKTYTCKNDATHTYTEKIAALGHAWDEGKVTKAPTCTEKGVKTYTCKNDASHTKTEDIAALGHDIDPEKYGSDGTHHWLICNTCGQIASEKVPHNYNVKGTDGYWYCVCGAKGDKIDTDTGKDEQPKNGDITPYFVMGVATLVAMSAAVVYVDKKRKSAR